MNWDKKKSIFPKRDWMEFVYVNPYVPQMRLWWRNRELTGSPFPVAQHILQNKKRKKEKTYKQKIKSAQ